MYNGDQFLFEQTGICKASHIQQLTMEKEQKKLILSFFGGKSKPNSRWPSFHRAPRQLSFSLMVLKRCRTIGRGTLQVFWWILCLSVGKEVASQPLSQTAFFNPAQKSLIGLRELTQGGLAPWGTNLILLQEVQCVVCHVGIGQIHLPLIPSASNPICP